MQSKTSDLLSPLDLFCVRDGRPPPEAVPIEPPEIPEPYRKLLVHSNDMTHTLEAYHDAGIYLEPRTVIDASDEYAREVVLRLEGSGKPVEYGAIRIFLNRLDVPVQVEIRDARRPLGTLLEEYSQDRESRPEKYFRILPDRTIREIFGEDAGDAVYARQNRIVNRAGECIAQVLEILPR
jgi:hypothetical protein